MRIRLLALLLLGCIATMAAAQPPAPIAWGTGRWFGTQDTGSEFDPIVVDGDNLLMVTRSDDGRMVAYSHDDGHTCSSWQRIDSPSQPTSYSYPAVSAGRAYIAMRNMTTLQGWARISMDAGQTWGANCWQQPNTLFLGIIASGLNVVVSQPLGTETEYQPRVAYSTDGGTTWLWRQDVNPTRYNIWRLALTQQAVIVLANSGIPESNDSIFVASAGRATGQFCTFTPLIAHPGGAHQRHFSVAGDTATETALVLTAWQNTLTAPSSLWINRTTNSGQSWDSGTCIEYDAAILGPCSPRLFCRGPLWGVAWRGLYGTDTSQGGMYCKFSANFGRAWYPRQRIDNRMNDIVFSTGQFTGNEIRAYWLGTSDTSWHYWDYRTVSGAIQPDTVPPVVYSTARFEDSLAVGDDPLPLWVTAEDNDSLWQVQVIIQRVGSPDSTVVGLTSTGQTEVYSGLWAVSADTADYAYYYRLEDMWEHVVTIPDSGAYHVHVEPLIDQTSPLILRPSSFILSAYPNPFNSTTEIRYALPRAGHVSLKVFDVLGREVGVLVDEIVKAGEQRVAFDARGLASGIYFVRLDAGETRVTRKVLLVR